MKERLSRIAAVAGLILDVRLAALREAETARSKSRARLADLAIDHRADDLPLVAGGKADLAYQQWADRRRVEINMVLARQTAVWLAARDEAAQSFGRSEVLRQLAAKSRPMRPR